MLLGSRRSDWGSAIHRSATGGGREEVQVFKEGAEGQEGPRPFKHFKGSEEMKGSCSSRHVDPNSQNWIKLQR